MSFFDDSSLAFLPSGAAGKDGKAYSIKPVPVYGSELVTNGDFATDSDWTKGTGWSIANGYAESDGTTSNLDQTGALTTGKTYKAKVTISNMTTGTLSYRIGSNSGDEVLNITQNGTYTAYGVAGNSTIRFRSQSGFDGRVDNVSVKEVLVNGDFTFSRGSNLAATRVGPTGLIEKGRENLLLQSNQFDTTWATSNASVTSGQSGYDGSSDAWLFTATNTAANLIQSVSSSGVNTFSIYAKAGTQNGIFLRADGGDNPRLFFKLNTGTIGSQSGTIIDSSIESVGNGWYRVSLVVNVSITQVRLYVADDNNNFPSSGNIYIQDAQLEIGLAATEVIESGATTGKAGLLEDEPRFDYSGGATCPSLLLEPSRTNLVTQSEYFGGSYWTNSGTSVVSGFTSPEGLSNAYKLVEDSANSRHFINSSEVTTPDTTYSSSVYIKANGRNKVAFRENSFTGKYASFNLSDGTLIETNGVSASIESASNGWYRINYELTSGSNYILGIYLLSDSYTSGDPYSSPYQGDGSKGAYIYGAQLESGSYPTSYIPNHSGGTITRGVDDCQDAGDTASINSTEGVLYVEASALADDGTSRMIALSDASSNNHIRIYPTTTSNRITIAIKSGNVNQYVYHYDGLSDITETWKVAVKYKANDFATFVNGTKVNSSTSGSAPVGLNELQYNGGNSASPFYGNVKQTLVFPSALSDADCITLTT